MARAPESETLEARLDHSGLAARRLAVCAALGIAGGAIAVVAGASWSVAALCAYDLAAIVFIVWVGMTVRNADARTTARLALAEDASRTAADATLLGAGAASLVAVAFTLGQAGHASGSKTDLLTALTLGSIALAWISVHTVFLLRYAKLFYTPPKGGIDFGGDEPDYRDFAYLALTIGMTFQVSDTDISGKRIRRVALEHALLSYVFGTGILAITVNTVAGLLGR